jgi:hypothetical protein
MKYITSNLLKKKKKKSISNATVLLKMLSTRCLPPLGNMQHPGGFY